MRFGLAAFVTLLVVVDPPGVVPIYVALTSNEQPARGTRLPLAVPQKKPPAKSSPEALLTYQLLKDYMSMPDIALGLLSSCSSEISASVVSIKPAIDAAFCNAQRVTFAGSIIPAATRFSKVSVSAL